MTARLNSVSSILPPCEVDIDETCRFVVPHAPPTLRARLERSLRESGNRTRYLVRPLAELARLRGASERAALYRAHAESLSERAVARLDDAGVLRPADVTAVIFASSTGWAAPSIDSHLVRRFGLNPRCRRIPLVQLGCGGGVAALALASELVRYDSRQRVLVVSAEVPSLHLQLGEGSYWDLVAAAQFADGAAAAVVSREDVGPDIVLTRSTLLPEVEEGGRILAGETGFRLVASGGLPQLIRSKVRRLVEECLAGARVDASALSFVGAHPRGRAVIDAIEEGLQLERPMLDASLAAWRRTGNMISASIYRVLVELIRVPTQGTDAHGLLLAFGTGVACEMALLRWTSSPALFCDEAP